MAVQAQQQCVSHAFLPTDLGHAFGGGGGMLLDALGVGGAAVFGSDAQQPRSELTCNANDVGFYPMKRARVAAAEPCGLMGGVVEQQQGLAVPLAVSQGQVFGGDVQSRALGCGAASTSGRAAVGGGACLSPGVVSELYHQDLEINALVRLQMERIRLGLQELRQRRLPAVVAAVERAAAGQLGAAEAEFHRARYRNAELEERLRQLTAEGQAWLGVAKSHEAVAAGLRTTLDQLLLQQPASGAVADGHDAEDAQSCCFDTGATAPGDDASSRGGAASCKRCCGAEACVLLLPCRHLCLCRACEAAVDACPVCAATKNASLQVLLS